MPSTVSQYVQSKGVDCYAEDYNHDDNGYWKIVPDGSVSSPSAEVVSPILRGARKNASLDSDTYDIVSRVTEGMREAGARVDVTCGLHVHHDAAGIHNPSILLGNWQRWEAWQPVIDLLVPKSRRGLRDYIGRKNLGQSIEQDLKSNPQFDPSYYSMSRYANFNVLALADHGTVEFRQHSGTLNATKIWQWMRLTKLFMNPLSTPLPGTLGEYRQELGFTTEGRWDSLIPGQDVETLIGDMFSRLGGADDLAEYYIGRYRSLNTTEGDEEDQKQQVPSYEWDDRPDNGYIVRGIQSYTTPADVQHRADLDGYDWIDTRDNRDPSVGRSCGCSCDDHSCCTIEFCDECCIAYPGCTDHPSL